MGSLMCAVKDINPVEVLVDYEPHFPLEYSTHNNCLLNAN
jgi:hypothetical protein